LITYLYILFSIWVGYLPPTFILYFLYFRRINFLCIWGIMLLLGLNSLAELSFVIFLKVTSVVCVK